MSWEFREYAQEEPWREPATWHGIRLPPRVVAVLLVLHAAAYLAVLAARWDLPTTSPYLNGVSSQHADIRPLTILFHPYTPASTRLLGGLLLFALVISLLWSLGRMVHDRVGPRRLLLLYVLGNAMSGLFYWSAANVFPALCVAPLDYPVGALSAWALLAYQHMQFEYVPVFDRMQPLPRVVAVGALILAAAEVLNYGSGAAFWIVSAMVGAGALHVAPFLERLGHGPRARFFRRVHRPDFRPRSSAQHSAERGTTVADADSVELDRMLAKISREGMTALSEQERETLERLRQERLRHAPSQS